MSTVDFRRELEGLINRHSMEAGSNTPDYILADYLFACLTAFDAAVSGRERWHNRIADGGDTNGQEEKEQEALQVTKFPSPQNGSTGDTQSRPTSARAGKGVESAGAHNAPSLGMAKEPNADCPGPEGESPSPGKERD